MPSGVYPAPIVVPPAKLPHRQSLILLHGRGSNAYSFSRVLLAWYVVGPGVAPDAKLRDLLPHAAFIFPTAAPRTTMTQWFEGGLPTAHAHPPIKDGLRASTAFVDGLVRAEIAKVGAAHVALGGLSQGCATILTSLLLHAGPDPPAAYVGLCGWLPFAEAIAAAGMTTEEQERDHSGGNEAAGTAPDAAADAPAERRTHKDTAVAAARAMLRAALDLPAAVDADVPRPVFLGHGMEDGTISIHLGRQAARCLEGLGLDVRWEEYAACGHWYSDRMLYGVVRFLREKAGWEIAGWDERAESAEEET